MPSPSEPITMQSLPPSGASHTLCSACSVAPHTQKPASLSSSMAVARLETCAMGRCMTAPAEVL